MKHIVQGKPMKQTVQGKPVKQTVQGRQAQHDSLTTYPLLLTTILLNFAGL
ncbi:MAG: hypothetical protein ACLQQ4_03800 [Bacteroidia bacterium]